MKKNVYLKKYKIMGIFKFFSKLINSGSENIAKETSKRMLERAKKRGFSQKTNDALDRVELEKAETDYLLGKTYEGNNPKIIQHLKDLEEKKEEGGVSEDEKSKEMLLKKPYHDKYGKIIGERIYYMTNRTLKKESYPLLPDEDKAITEKYGKERANDIFNFEINTDYTLEEVYIIFGEHKHKTTSISRGKKVEKYYFEKSVNRLGNTTYDILITFTDGKLTNWTDLTLKSKKTKNEDI